jgi:hypothetical protein
VIENIDLDASERDPAMIPRAVPDFLVNDEGTDNFEALG